MAARGLWDVTELVWITETEWGVTPTTGTWKPVGGFESFTPEPRPVLTEKGGLGSQTVTDQQLVKLSGRFTIEHELKEKVTDPAFDWYNLLDTIVNKDGSGNPQNYPKHFSLGAKLDLATDEFWHLKGCTIEEYTVEGRSADDTIRGRITGIAKQPIYGTTDYVSGSATRQSEPSSDAIVFGEADVEVPDGSSILGELISWSLTLRRTLTLRGADSAEPTLYGSIVPSKREYTLRIARDFRDKAEVENFINATERTAALEIPSASGGWNLALTGGRWRAMTKTFRDLDLIGFSFEGRFSGLVVTAIT